MDKIWDIFEVEKEEKKSSIWDMFEKPTITTQPILETKPLIEGLPISKPEDKTKPVKKFGVGAEIEVPSSQYGISDLNKPEQMGKIQKGVISAFGTWEAKKRAMPELQKMEDFANYVASEAVPLAQSRYGEGYSERGSAIEEVAVIYERLTDTPKEETLKEIEGIKDRNIFFATPPEKYKEAVKLHQQLRDIRMRVAEPGKDIIGQVGWSGMVAILGTEAVAGIMSVSPIIKEKLLNKTIKTNVSTEKSFKALQDISGRGGTTEQMKLFRTIVEQAKAKGVSVSDVIRKGVTTTETVPRFAFAGKLYAGLPADEIAKSIIEVGKVTAEAVKGLDPVKVSQITQQLLNTSPALASEFLKAVEKPEGVKEAVEGEAELVNMGAEVIGDKVKLYRGGDVSETELKNLRYNDYLSTVKTGKDKTGNEGASAYGKNIVEVTIPIKDIVVVNGEIQYKGKSQSLEGGKKYPPEIYKAYNDVYGSNYTAEEIDKQDNVRVVASQGLSGGREEFDELTQAKPKAVAEISKEIFKESISESESIAEKQSMRNRTIEGVKSGELTGAVRFGSIIELEKTLKNKKLPVSKEYDEIHAQPIIDKDDDYFAVYGPYDKHTIGIVIPSEYTQPKPDAHTKEVIVNPDVPVEKLKFIIKDKVYTYDEILETTGTREYAMPEAIVATGEGVGGTEEKPIPAELEGLAEEGEVVYRASAKPFSKDIMGKDGIFVTPDKTFAERWQKSQKYGNLEELIISKDAKILKRKDIPKEFIEVKNGNNIISDQDAVIKYAKENGYDGYEEYGIDSKGNIIDREIAIWNKDKISTTPITEQPSEVAPVAEKATTVPTKAEVIPEVKPEPELATPAQIKEADIFAKEHKLITETPSGKMSDLRYKRLAKNMTGKTSVKDMTKEEADEFIESIKSIVQRRPWEPPIIPLSTKIVPKEFFEIEFKEPGISKIITPKKYYLRILGAEPLLKPLIDSMELLSLKTGEVNKWINDVIKKINKEATIAQKFKARVFNRPTDRVATMRDLLDKYENPPDSLTHSEKEIFKEVRDFTKDILVKTNEVRDRVGLEPIKDIKTYIPHFLDELAKQIVNKKYPFPEDVKYWLGRNMPKKVYNPTAIERRVRDDLEDFFSKDLGSLLRTLAKYDLRDIYLSEPYSILRAELNALGDKIPASLRKEIDAFLKHDIFNYPTELDQLLNTTLKTPTDVINFFLKPLNRTISNPISSLSNIYRQGLMGGAIALKPRLVLRNLLTQKLLNMNIYPVKDYLKAQFWLTPKGVMDEIRDTTFYKLSIRKFEDLPPLLKPVQWGMWPYSKSHAGINYISNVDVSGKVGYYYGKDMIDWCETSKGKTYIEKYAKKHNLTGKAKNDLTWRKGDEIDEAVEAMSVTQWLYFSTDMPRVFRGKGARAFWSLQSWWMNWFGKHLREGLIRMGGKTSRGRIVRPGDRINFIKGLLIILALTEGVRRTTGVDMKRFLFFPFPTYIYPPAMQLILNTYYLITANTEQKRKSAINGLKNNLTLLIPFSGATKRWWRYIKGEITLKEWLFYVERKKEVKKTPPKSGVWETVEPKKSTKSDIWETFETKKESKSEVWAMFE